MFYGVFHEGLQAHRGDPAFEERGVDRDGEFETPAESDLLQGVVLFGEFEFFGQGREDLFAAFEHAAVDA